MMMVMMINNKQYIKPSLHLEIENLYLLAIMIIYCYQATRLSALSGVPRSSANVRLHQQPMMAPRCWVVGSQLKC